MLSKYLLLVKRKCVGTYVTILAFTQTTTLSGILLSAQKARRSAAVVLYSSCFDHFPGRDSRASFDKYKKCAKTCLTRGNGPTKLLNSRRRGLIKISSLVAMASNSCDRNCKHSIAYSIEVPFLYR